MTTKLTPDGSLLADVYTYDQTDPWSMYTIRGPVQNLLDRLEYIRTVILGGSSAPTKTILTHTIVAGTTWESASTTIQATSSALTVLDVAATMFRSNGSGAYFRRSFAVSDSGAAFAILHGDVSGDPVVQLRSSDDYDMRFALNTVTGVVSIQFYAPVAAVTCTAEVTKRVQT